MLSERKSQRNQPATFECSTKRCNVAVSPDSWIALERRQNHAGAGADLIIRPDMNEYETEHAYDLDPWHPLVHLALAGFEEDPIRADFLRRYSLDRLPNDPKLRKRAAEFLRKQGKEDLAREVELRGQ
jgi:hypothetical protein